MLKRRKIKKKKDEMKQKKFRVAPAIESCLLDNYVKIFGGIYYIIIDNYRKQPSPRQHCRKIYDYTTVGQLERI